ncbi:non-heme iron oxygenase ferredoxin subunit [Sphingobium boeckii]|uniref:Nitrite reductase/ring-hydroxylating ferredoxin subunit n=1 Tax=Sphingobium boeckii TaxID=1082345 RepID=A0A7W9AIY1_9SPHN|nr:non-heme iron oxygenase ferredoxin subunit [Sphingobium boeckii]MBB5686349.1 nitrite reductase/ring-hydroxylating ferredoxin subunit [Sphingobium boeckii]
MSHWYDVGPEGLVPEGEVAGVNAGGKPIALVLHEGSHYALYDLCTHGEAQLSEGWVEDGCLECPLHQGKFCLKTGEAVSAPVYEPVAAFEVRVRDGRIEVFA